MAFVSGCEGRALLCWTELSWLVKPFFIFCSPQGRASGVAANLLISSKLCLISAEAERQLGGGAQSKELRPSVAIILGTLSAQLFYPEFQIAYIFVEQFEVDNV